MSASAIIRMIPLGFPWETMDPFLFCVHHEDYYPSGNERLGPDPSSLIGRPIGQDFVIKDGWRMYHGESVPGFPGHPHRGFETVTVVQQGVVDHADSMGAAGRYGNGDVQWMTAGKGIQHSEMFPLLNQDQPNTLELFQIWLNLPQANKMVDPYFAMFWKNMVPRYAIQDEEGRSITIEMTAGTIGNFQCPAPPPNSWASVPDHRVAIWVITMEKEARWNIPVDEQKVNRMLYFFQGDSIRIAGDTIIANQGIQLQADQVVTIENGSEDSRFLLLQGKPIKEPVVHYGPFVMNSRSEIQQTIADYHATQFGGWPWPSHEPTHPPHQGRFARHANGHEENPHP